MNSLTDNSETTAVGQLTRFRVGIALAISGTFLFALKSIFIKLAFDAETSTTVLLTLRMLLSLPFYVAILWFDRRSELKASPGKPSPQASTLKAFSLGFLGYYLASYLDLSGLELISAQLERLTLFTYPALVAILAWLFLGEALGPRIVLAVLLSYAGLGLMYGNERLTTGNPQQWQGVLLVMGSALSYSLYILFAKPIMLSVGSRRFTSLAMIGSTLFVCIHFGCTNAPSDLVSQRPIVYFYGVLLAFVCTVLPSFMINESIVRIGATRTTVIGSIGPVLTMFLAILVLGESSSWLHLMGMGISIFGISLVTRK